MLRYAITSRALYPGDERQQQAALLLEAGRWIAEGVEFIQLREKDLPAAVLADIARKILNDIKLLDSPTKLLVNSRSDIAIASGAHGVHLTSSRGELTSMQIRSLYVSAALAPPLITVSCHTLDEVYRARQEGVDAILFAPVFEKALPGETIAGTGLDRLGSACTVASPLPVYALGGVTMENAPRCLEAGAAGIAGIRLFHNL
jgi:thiamine-phosphate pyrophosphorylase